MIVHLKANNLSLCLNHEHLKFVLPKIITENYVLRLASVGKNFIKIEQESTLE
jgi:hypothetical protein